MADEESKSSPTSSGSDARQREGLYRYRTRDEDKKKTDTAPPPWQADLKPRTRPAPKPKPTTPETSPATPKWGAPYTPKSTSPYKKPVPTPTKAPPSPTTKAPAPTTESPPILKSESLPTPEEETVSVSFPEPESAPAGESVTIQSRDPVVVAVSEEPLEATFTLGSVTFSSDTTPAVDIEEELVQESVQESVQEPVQEPVQAPAPKHPPVEVKQDKVPKRPSFNVKPAKIVKQEKPPAEVKKEPEPPKDKEPEKEPEKEKEDVQVDPQIVRSWEQDANNGSEDHQVKLGQHFLSLADSDIDREANAKLALDWLIKASKQGNEDATTLLKSCVDRNLPGIEERDAYDIKWCLNTSSYEKKIRHAARNLFQKINTTHKDALSRDEYMDAVKGLTGKVKEQKLLMAAGKKIGKEISENEFVKMLSKKIQGTVTLTSQELMDTNVSYESAGYLTKIVRYPRQTAATVVDQVLEYSSKEGLNWVVSLIPTNQLYVLGLLFVYSFITPDFIFFFVPLFIFYLSFAAIIICTLQMFYKRKKQKDAATLAGVLKELDVSIDLDKTESQYTWNSLTPYIVFFVNLPLVIMSFSLCNKSYVPCAEISVISLVMTTLCFFSLSDHHDKLTIFALFANFLSSLPVFLHNFPSVPLLKVIVGALTDPFVALDTGVGIKFNVSIPSIAYAAIPLFFARMAMKKSWEGTYRVLVPHLVCYFWFNITTTTFPYTSWLGLTRATVGYLLLPLILPLSVVGVFVMIIFAAYKAFQTEMLGKIVVTLVLLSVPILMTQTKKIFGKKFDAKFGIAKKVLMVIFALLALVPLIFVRIPVWKKEVPIELSYENYTQLCFREKVVNDVPQQITCSHLEGTKVRWVGTVEGVTVTKIENTAESVLSSLPSLIAKPLYCMYGQEYPQCDRKLLSKKGYSFCTVMRGLGHKCHVKNHNVYHFEILVLTGSQNIKIDAGDNFKETILALEIGDTIEYKGTLKDNLGGTVPKMKVSSLKTINRELPIMMKIDDDDDSKMMSAIQEAIAVTFNFIWYPLLEFSVKE